MVRVKFLGTGTSMGVPVIACQCPSCLSNDKHDKRLRTSVFVETKDLSLVIDAGPDFRYQMLRAHINKLDAILITHAHKDHYAGLDDVRAFNYFLNSAMPVYARQADLNIIKKEFKYVFADEKYPGVPDIVLHEIENKPFAINGTTITPIDVLHHRMPVFGFRLEDFVYITDANYIPEEEISKLQDAKVIVLNALRRRQHLSHFTLEQAVALLQKLKPERAYLTHISHQMGLHRDVAKELPDFISLAYDELEINV